VGDEDHPEVRGLMGFASAGGLAIPYLNNGFIDLVPKDREICVVAQTTQENETFDRVVNELRNWQSKIFVYNTICDSTKRRQLEVSRLARQVDTIVVVGGKGSGNTQRLLKVAQEQGVPALHVETDEEIPPLVFSGARTVGVTAGASTPNWQIRRVIDRLRQIGMSRTASPLRRLKMLGDIAVMTYCWAALGGGGLTAACLMLERRSVTWLPLAVTMLFVFSMHLLNRIQERAGAVRFNTPEIAAFYARHRKLLTFLGALSSLAAIALSYQMGAFACLLLVGMLVAGRMYTVPLPGPQFSKLKWRSLKDLPGSKTPLVALGWAVSAAILPAADSVAALMTPGTIIAFGFAGGMVFWRTALSDLLDIQGDRIVGRETIPILIGVKHTRELLRGLLLSLAAMLLISALVGWIPRVGYALVFNTLVFAASFIVYKRRHLADRLWFEAVMDGNFLLAGIISMVYGMS
jgi:4-hydroxy-3-methylbut-2-enyl diphosphate reductase